MSPTESATAPTRAGVIPSTKADGAPSSPKTPSDRAAAAIAVPCPISVLRGLATSASGVSKQRNAVAPRLGKTSGSETTQAIVPLTASARNEPRAVTMAFPRLPQRR